MLWLGLLNDMSAVPKQTHSDLFFKPHVAGRAFHTHAVVHYSGSVPSPIFSYFHGAEGRRRVGHLLSLMNPRKNIKTHKGNKGPNKYDISDSTFLRRSFLLTRYGCIQMTWYLNHDWCNVSWNRICYEPRTKIIQIRLNPDVCFLKSLVCVFTERPSSNRLCMKSLFF